MNYFNPYETPSPWNPNVVLPPDDLPLPTGLAGFDADTGGLDGIMVFAAFSSSPRVFLALALALAAMKLNPRLGAMICAVTMSINKYRLALTTSWSGISRRKIWSGDLDSAERDRLQWAQTDLETHIGHRLKILQPEPLWPGNYSDRPFPAANILNARERLLRSGAVDRCAILIDELHMLGVPKYAEAAPLVGYDSSSRYATEYELGRRQFAIAQEVWQGMRGSSRFPQDPVLAVTGTHREKEWHLKPNDIIRRLGAAATAVGLLQISPAERYRPGSVSPMDLDLILRRTEERRRIPLMYDYDTARFWDAESGAPLGW